MIALQLDWMPESTHCLFEKDHLKDKTKTTSLVFNGLRPRSTHSTEDQHSHDLLSNKGGNTAGIDGIIWKKDTQKF